MSLHCPHGIALVRLLAPNHQLLHHQASFRTQLLHQQASFRSEDVQGLSHHHLLRMPHLCKQRSWPTWDGEAWVRSVAQDHYLATFHSPLLLQMQCPLATNPIWLGYEIRRLPSIEVLQLYAATPRCLCIKERNRHRLCSKVQDLELELRDETARIG